MTKCVLLQENLEDIEEVDINVDENYKILKGPTTFIGQWSDLDVVILKRAKRDDYALNENILPAPFENEITYGPILLVRMDEHVEPRDFTLAEYMRFRLEQH